MAKAMAKWLAAAWRIISESGVSSAWRKLKAALWHNWPAYQWRNNAGENQLISMAYRKAYQHQA
jgi:hypothetical protein